MRHWQHPLQSPLFSWSIRIGSPPSHSLSLLVIVSCPFISSCILLTQCGICILRFCLPRITFGPMLVLPIWKATDFVQHRIKLLYFKKWVGWFVKPIDFDLLSFRPSGLRNREKRKPQPQLALWYMFGYLPCTYTPNTLNQVKNIAKNKNIARILVSWFPLQESLFLSSYNCISLCPLPLSLFSALAFFPASHCDPTHWYDWLLKWTLLEVWNPGTQMPIVWCMAFDLIFHIFLIFVAAFIRIWVRSQNGMEWRGIYGRLD